MCGRPLGMGCLQMYVLAVYLCLKLDTGAFLRNYGYLFQLACFLMSPPMFCSQYVGIFSIASL
jgi:hypothetical protein